ncbi:MAG TPA: hypothetical protein PKY01_10455 [Candidatus Hydrogenedentes bacterium]|nr:hypothetical protein [Candidatus Hydrogenedentota bacterium]
MKKFLMLGVGVVFILLLATGCPPQYVLTLNVVGQGGRIAEPCRRNLQRRHASHLGCYCRNGLAF